MTIKELNKLYLQWNAGDRTQRFGQYVLSNSVLQHHLSEEVCQYVYYEVNSVVAYNKILLVCSE